MTVGQKPATAEELFCTPDDGLRRELVRGEVRTMAPAGYEHGRISHNFSSTLDRHVRGNGRGTILTAETGFKIAGDPDTVRAPDVAFVARERVPAAGEVSNFRPEAPDLMVEVVSPSDKLSEVEEKVEDWISAGSRMVVDVNPRGRTATVRLPQRRVEILTQGEVIDGGDVVPGRTLPVSDLFR